MAGNPVTNAPINVSDPNQFRAVVNEDFAKTCRFSVRINLPRIFQTRGASNANTITLLRDLTFLCEAAEITGRGFETVDHRMYGPSQKMPFATQYNDINLVFMCRSRMTEKLFFDTWQNKISPTSTYDMAYLDDYATSIDIMQFDDEGNGAYQQTLEKAYPLIVNPMQTSWADDNILRLPVTFTFRRWRSYDRFETAPSDLNGLVADSHITFQSIFGNLGGLGGGLS